MGSFGYPEVIVVEPMKAEEMVEDAALGLVKEIGSTVSAVRVNGRCP